MNAIDDVAAERERQKTAEGWTPEHDDCHDTGQLATAAATYILYGAGSNAPWHRPNIWPWDWSWWKPKDRRRDLVRAGALIVAEIERFDRASQPIKRTDGYGNPAKGEYNAFLADDGSGMVLD